MRWLEYTLFLGTVIALARPVGLYVARVFEEKPTPLDPLFRPLERMLFRLIGVRPQDEMTAGVYLGCFLAFSVLCTAFLFVLLDAPEVAARRPRRPLPDHPHDGRPGGEHRPQLLDHDDLAGVRRRDDPPLSDPGRRPGVAELPRRGGRAGGGRGVHSRVRPRAVGDARQLLGRPDPGTPVGPAARVPRG